MSKQRKQWRRIAACALSRVVNLLRDIYVQQDTNAYQETKLGDISVQAVKLYLDDRPNNDPVPYRAYMVLAVVRNSQDQLLRLVPGAVQYESTLETGNAVTTIPEE